MNKNLLSIVLSSLMLMALTTNAQAESGIKITEWMYNSNASTVSQGGEFVELTNFGDAAVDFTGWSFDDNSRSAGSESLSSFGSVAVGESVIFTEMSAANFRSVWNLSSDVKVIGGISNNLGRSDEVNIYDNAANLVDRLTFNDQGTGLVKSPRTNGVSGNPGDVSVLGANNASAWTLSSSGDANASWQTTAGDIGNPGTSSLYVAAVPEPETYAMMLAGLGLMGFVARRRQ